MFFPSEELKFYCSYDLYRSVLPRTSTLWPHLRYPMQIMLEFSPCANIYAPQQLWQDLCHMTCIQILRLFHIWAEFSAFQRSLSTLTPKRCHMSISPPPSWAPWPALAPRTVRWSWDHIIYYTMWRHGYVVLKCRQNPTLGRKGPTLGH